ncbi:MAG: D-sedoheptulose 7-phosphate isomerase [Thermodesulfobacteriota bacterium]|nr:D-sedoheptulose 7-phosphate isomerase [Thermodesulfobacteriota bacterium]
MQDIIKQTIQDNITLHENLFDIIPKIEAVAKVMLGCISKGNKIMFAGNGGSAADAQHLAAELVNRFLMERSPIAGLALTTDTSVITSIGNDYSFDDLFLKQVIALGIKGDVLFSISTSGNSVNIIKAICVAKDMGIITVGMTGSSGGKMKGLVDYLIPVPSSETPRIQEAHILIGHIICEIIERMSNKAICS